MMRDSVVVLDDGRSTTAGGVYVLRIRVDRPVAVVFGGFHGGEPIHVDVGEYAYTGSARAARGPSSLSSRLIRHATRSAGPPHAIRDELVREFDRLGTWNGRIPSGKKLFWNVDHLLERDEAHFAGVVALRSSDRLEGCVARFVEDEPCTSHVVKGLGANDAPGNTHLLRVDADEAWWRRLPERLPTVVAMASE